MEIEYIVYKRKFKSIKILGNSIRELLFIYKQLLYKIYIMPITLYSF